MAERTLGDSLSQLAAWWQAFLDTDGPRKIAEAIKDALDQIPDDVALGCRFLAKHEWYPPSNFPMRPTPELLALSKEELDRFMERFIQEHTDRYETELCEAHPQRVPILKQAFAAHRRSEFALSIPVLLTQADGICFESTGLELYKRRNGEPVLAAHVSGLDRFDAAFCDGLRLPFPINFNPVERAETPPALNRHTVLHGESIDYPSLTNSCRAISLISYVSTVLDAPAV